MRSIVLVLVAALTACGSPDAASPATTAAPPPTAAPVPPSIAPPPPTAVEIVQAQDFMALRDGSLDQCVTTTITNLIPPGASWRPGPLPETTTEGVVAVAQGCDAQFASRVPLGTCTATSTTTASGTGEAPAGTVITMTTVRRYYQLSGDQRMTACIGRGDTWQETPR